MQLSARNQLNGKIYISGAKNAALPLICASLLTKDTITLTNMPILSDIKSLNPATALRKAGYGASVPLFCTQEAEITGMLKKVIRVLITGYFDEKPIPVYANGAEVLRPDLAK